MNNDYLKHYGVLGMHWGKHKRQDSVSIQKHKKEVLRDTKILEKINCNSKSNYQLKMESKYKKQGLTDDEAIIAAYHNIKTKKMLLTVGMTAIVIGGTYAAYKIHNERIDKIIKSGSMLQHITNDSSPGIRDAFYSSNNKLDNIKYKGLFGSTLSRDGIAIKKEIKVLSDIKQASPKNAQKALEDLVKSDRQFSDDLHNLFKSNYLFKKDAHSINLKNGIVDKDVYEKFNIMMGNHTPEVQKLTDRYFSELTKKGYNAIKDVNDSKTEYKAFNPIIAFGTSGKVEVMSIKQLTNKEISTSKTIALASIIGGEVIKKGSMVTIAVLGTSTVSKKVIQNYRNMNPNTKLTNTEIKRILERSTTS